jgi:lysophospholipase L1-like esterase
MRRFVIFAMLLGVVAALLVWIFRAASYTNLPPRSGTTWVALGDSLTAGSGASPGNDYPALLGNELGVPIINAGVPGNTTQDGLGRIEEIIRLNPKAVLLCLGGNDGLRGVPADQTFQNLAAIIDRLHQSGAFVALIGIRSASLFDKNENRFKRLAKERKVFYVPDILKGVLGNSRLMSDEVHPNDEGYAAIAKRLEKELGPLMGQLSQ